MKRKFWWELLFISVLLFLLVGMRSQHRRETTAQALVLPAPAAVISAIVQAPPPLALK